MQEQKKISTFKKILLFLLFFLVLFFVYIHFIEPNWITVKEYAIVDNALPYSFHGLKIVHFSDILYSSQTKDKTLEKMVEKINALNPDVVVYTGDLISSSLHINEEAENKLKDLLKSIHANLKKYAVIGDTDYQNKIQYMNILESAEFMILNNKNDVLYYEGETPLLFIGTSSLLEHEYSFNDATTSTEDISSYYKIWLNHEPILLDHLEEYTIQPNLLFTGHTLGGLVKLPFHQTLLKQNGTKEYVSDYYEKGSMKLYINNGIGTYKYSVRFLNPPSINFYRLYQY